MTTRIGWYVHHHGGGHLARMMSIAPHLDADIRCFSSLARPENLPPHCTWTVLERDDDASLEGGDPADADPTAAGLLHWAPLGHAGHRSRLARVAASLAADPVDAFVVDVSVEVTLFVRLLGIRTVVFTQPGLRDDTAHRLGYQAAATIIAPWPQELLEPAHLAEVRAKTVYTGGISKFDGRPRPHQAAGSDVVLLGGRGGSGLTDHDVDAAATATGRRWRNLGGTGEATWSADPWNDLTTAGVVVAWAGQNSIADLAAADASAVVIPQSRPFDEQHQMALALDRAGLAVVAPRWPDASEWPDLIERASTLRPDWSRWHVSGAAQRAATAIVDGARPRTLP